MVCDHGDKFGVGWFAFIGGDAVAKKLLGGFIVAAVPGYFD